MLSLKQWNERGWLANKLLFLPQGYAQAIEFLDEPQLRHHAHGISPGSSPLVGPRLLYTHYPSGYLIPLATLYKLGFTNKFPLQTLSILFSVAAVGLFYLLLCRLASPQVAFFSTLFYVASPFFHFFADSLANQPLDDLLRFAFMLAIVRSTRETEEISRRNWNVLAWVLQFCLSLSSLDSVFFIYTWLVGWDLIEGKGFRWKRWLIFGFAPLLAHGLQFLQNVWYLGLHDAARDAVGTFGAKSKTTVGAFARIREIYSTLTAIIDPLFGAWWLFIIALLMLAFHYTLTKREGSDLGFPRLRAVFLFAAAGLPFILLLPVAAGMFYEPRQLLPFAALVMGVLAWRLVLSIASLIRSDLPHNSLWGKRGSLAFTLLFTLSALGFLMGPAKKTFGPAEYLRTVHAAYGNEISLAGELAGKLPSGKDAIIFSLDGFSMLWGYGYVEGYPQICPVLEYALGRPILCFQKPEDLASDLRELSALGRADFTPIIATSNDQTMLKILTTMEKEGMIDILKAGRIPTSSGVFVELSGAMKPLPPGGLITAK